MVPALALHPPAAASCIDLFDSDLGSLGLWTFLCRASPARSSVLAAGCRPEYHSAVLGCGLPRWRHSGAHAAVAARAGQGGCHGRALLGLLAATVEAAASSPSCIAA